MKYSTIILAALASSASAKSLSFSSGGEVPSGLPTATKHLGSSGDAFPTSAAGCRGESVIGSFPTRQPSGGTPPMSTKAAFGNQFAAGTGAVGGTGHRHTGSARRTKSRHACKSARPTIAARRESSEAAISTESAPPSKPSDSGSFSHHSSHGSGGHSGATQGSGCDAGNKASRTGDEGSKPTGFGKPSDSMSGTPLSTMDAPNAAFIATRQASSDLPSCSFTLTGSVSKPTDGFSAGSGGQGQGQGGFSYPKGTTKPGDCGIPPDAPTTFTTSIKPTTTA